MAGEVLFREGELGHELFVILAGKVAVMDHQAGTERTLATGTPGEFIAELSLLTGERLFTTAVVTEAGAVLVVPVAGLQVMIGQDQGLGQWIIRTMFARRHWLLGTQAGMRIVGSRSSPRTCRLLEFAERSRLPHVWLDTDTDPPAGVVLAHHNTSAAQTPVVVMRGGELLRQPSTAELACAAARWRASAVMPLMVKAATTCGNTTFLVWRPRVWPPSVSGRERDPGRSASRAATASQRDVCPLTRVAATQQEGVIHVRTHRDNRRRERHRRGDRLAS